MIVCNTKKALANSTNANDVAGAVAVKEYIESNGDNLTPTSTVTVSTGVTKTLQTYIEDIAEDQAQIYVDETFTPNIIKASWTATESSAYNTALTASVNVPAGTYLIIATTPLSESTSSAFFRISNITGSGHTIYTGENLFYTTVSSGSAIACMKFATDQTGLALASGESASLTWNSSYLTRGAVAFIRIGA